MSSYPSSIKPIEVLSAAPGKLHDKPIVVLSVRTDPQNSFLATDFAISFDQAVRLRDDLTSLIESDQRIWAE